MHVVMQKTGVYCQAPRLHTLAGGHIHQMITHDKSIKVGVASESGNGECILCGQHSIFLSVLHPSDFDFQIE